MRRPVKRPAHGVAGQRCQPGRVHLMTELVKLPVIIQHILFILCGDGNLVGDSPADDTGMVVILDNQFLHLAYGVRSSIGHMFGNIRDFRPDHQAGLVAQIVEILIVLVMGEADRIGPNLTDELHVLLMVLLRDGIAQSLPVLMAGYAAQGIAAAV